MCICTRGNTGYRLTDTDTHALNHIVRFGARKQNVREGSAEASGKAKFAISLLRTFLTSTQRSLREKFSFITGKYLMTIFTNQPKHKKRTFKVVSGKLAYIWILKIWISKQRRPTSGGNFLNSVCL